MTTAPRRRGRSWSRSNRPRGPRASDGASGERREREQRGVGPNATKKDDGRLVRGASLLVLGAWCFVQTPAPQQAPVFRSTTTVVPITVTVLDANGLPVKDLKPLNSRSTKTSRAVRL
jgi:hypothetical protein